MEKKKKGAGFREHSLCLRHTLESLQTPPRPVPPHPAPAGVYLLSYSLGNQGSEKQQHLVQGHTNDLLQIMSFCRPAMIAFVSPALSGQSTLTFPPMFRYGVYVELIPSQGVGEQADDGGLTSEHVLVLGYHAWAQNGHRTYAGPTRAGTIGRSSRFALFVERKPGITGLPLPSHWRVKPRAENQGTDGNGALAVFSECLGQLRLLAGPRYVS